jgi:hypothetical protein
MSTREIRNVAIIAHAAPEPEAMVARRHLSAAPEPEAMVARRHLSAAPEPEAMVARRHREGFAR